MDVVTLGAALSIMKKMPDTAASSAAAAEDAADRAEEAARTLTIDDTLTQPGQAADAKATGDAIATTNERLQRQESVIDFQRKEPDVVTENWGMTNEGYAITNQNYNIYKYLVTPGEEIFCVAPTPAGAKASYAFTDFLSISQTNLDHIIGTPATTAVNGLVTVPDGAVYIFFSCLKTDTTSGVYASKPIDTLQADIMSLNTKADACLSRTDSLEDVIYGDSEIWAVENGSAPNGSNTDFVRTTGFIPVEYGKTVALLVRRPLSQDGNYYAFGYRTYNSEEGTITTVHPSANTKDSNIVTVGTNVAYIRYTIGEFYADGTIRVLRKTDFNDTDVIVCTDYVNSIIGSVGEDTNRLPSFTDDGIKPKCEEFTAHLKSIEKAESFMFITDPHLMHSDNLFDEADRVVLQKYMNEMKTYYSCLPLEFILDGGDWLNWRDYKVNAMEKLGYVDAVFKNVFGDGVRKPAVGNHDTNEQGYEDEENTETYSGRLNNEQLRLAWFSKEKHCYYSFDGMHTRFFVLDTGSDKSTTMSDYRWEQIDWMGKALEANTQDYVIVLMHIFYNTGFVNYDKTGLANNVLALASAYNSRATVTLNGISYDFTNATGVFSFILTGHDHRDGNFVESGIPVIFTMNGNALGAAGATFDMCVVDYAHSKIEMVRVGSGASRSITILT